MTREAVEDGFEYFLDDAIEATIEEFSVSRALRGARGPGGAAVDNLVKNAETLHRRVVQPELERYRRQTLAQFRVVLDYVESDADIDAYREQILETGAVVESIRTDVPTERRARVEDELLAHHRGLGEAVTPLLTSPEDSFWDATTAALTREEAETLVSEHFAFTGPLRRNREALKMSTTVEATTVLGSFGRVFPTPTFEVEYTDEALRAMYRAEQSVVQQANREIDRLFD